MLINATPLGSGAFPGQSPVPPEALRRRVDPAGRVVAIVGAGGAARAAAFALVRAGARVTVLARRAEQAAEVASATGCASAGLDALPGLAWDVLVNATPLGSGAFPGRSPVPPGALRKGAVVFDMVENS